MPHKILIAGSIRGSFDAFLKRLSSVQSKAGPFEAAFVVGDAVGNATPEIISKFMSDCRDLSFPVCIFDDEGAVNVANRQLSIKHWRSG